MSQKGIANKYLIGKSSAQLNKQYRQRNPIQSLLSVTKARCKRKQIEFNLAVKDIVKPLYCPVFGIELMYSVNTKQQYNSASLDRINPTKGYVSGNVIVVSWRANQLKQDASLDEMKQLVSFYSQLN